jgi:Sulfotransferase family
MTKPMTTDAPDARAHPNLLPPNFQDAGGLFLRLLQTRNRAAYFAMTHTALAVAATPLDLLLERAERGLYARAEPPKKPIVLVGGAPRSGTTILEQVLVKSLPVTYFNNLTAVFPRAPIMANRLFGRLLRKPRRGFDNFYGRTSGFAGRNDGLHLWDRWLGNDRYRPPTHLEPALADGMRRFFGAFEAAFGGPIANKNNALAICADVVAPVLPTAHFVCIRREPLYAVQSILGTREFIQGKREAPYGVGDPRYAGRTDVDPIEEVCAQVLYTERRMEEHQRTLGPSRFWIVQYEEFCRAPSAVAEKVADEILGVAIDRAAVRAALPPLRDTNKVKVSPAERERIAATLARLSAAAAAPGA